METQKYENIEMKCCVCGIKISTTENNDMCDNCFRDFLAENSISIY